MSTWRRSIRARRRVRPAGGSRPTPRSRRSTRSSPISRIACGPRRARSLLVVLQAMDAGGKDGTIKHVFRGRQPAGHPGRRRSRSRRTSSSRTTSSGASTRRRLAPARSAIFNRSHYEDVLDRPRPRARPRGHVEGPLRADQLVRGARSRTAARPSSSSSCTSRRTSSASVSTSRLDEPTKRWKFQPGDLAEREHWDEYQVAYADALSETATDDAPWYVIPADHKWYRNWAVSCILIDTLRGMDPHYPEPTRVKAWIVAEPQGDRRRSPRTRSNARSPEPRPREIRVRVAGLRCVPHRSAPRGRGARAEASRASCPVTRWWASSTRSGADCVRFRTGDRVGIAWLRQHVRSLPMVPARAGEPL